MGALLSTKLCEVPMKSTLRLTLTAVWLAAAALSAQAAPAVFDTGLIRMGVGNTGGLGQGTGGVGLVGPTGDAITPGCLCEGWGAAASGTGNFTYGAGGTVGFTSSTTNTNGINGVGMIAQIGCALAEDTHQGNQFFASFHDFMSMQIKKLKESTFLWHEASEHA